MHVATMRSVVNVSGSMPVCGGGFEPIAICACLCLVVVFCEIISRIVVNFLARVMACALECLLFSVGGLFSDAA